jgi:glutamine amidotransferase
VNRLFVSEDVDSIRSYPEAERFAHFSGNARVVASEPLIDLPGVWREIPISTALIAGDTVQERPFPPPVAPGDSRN